MVHLICQICLSLGIAVASKFLESMAGTTGLEPATSAVTVMLSSCKQMISWAFMANYSTLEHSKTLGKTQFQNFSTLTSTLAETRVPRA